MSSSARNAQGASLTLGVAGTAKTATAITKTNPPVFTSAAHGFTEGLVIVVTAATGMPEINGRVGITRNVAANTGELAGIDASAFAAAATAGTLTPTAVVVGNFKGFSGLDGQSSDIDVTDLASLAKEFRSGLMDNGQFSAQLQWLAAQSDLGQDALRASQIASGPSTQFKLAFKDGKFISFPAYVKQFSISGQVDGIVEGNVSARISGPYAMG